MLLLMVVVVMVVMMTVMVKCDRQPVSRRPVDRLPDIEDNETRPMKIAANDVSMRVVSDVITRVDIVRDL